MIISHKPVSPTHGQGMQLVIGRIRNELKGRGLKEV